MAKKVTVKIGSHFDKGGVEQAKGGIKGLGDSAGKAKQSFVDMAAKAYVALKAVQAVGKATGRLVDAYGEQEEATIRLAVAAKNNPLLNLEAVDSLKEFAGALQEVTKFGDEAIIQQQSFLATLGMSEDTIKGVMSAATDLASTGMMSLDSAVKNLAKTYGGMTGELGEAIPALKDLTAEQLKAGAAVEHIKSAYGGMAQAVASGSRGAIQQMKNIFGDIQEKLGGIIVAVAKGFGSQLKPILLAIDKWLAANSDKIVNFFLHLPQMAGIAFEGIKKLAGQYFSAEYLGGMATVMWDAWLEYGKAVLTNMWNMVQAIGTSIWEPMKYGFEMIVWGLKDGFASMINFFIDKLNTLADAAHFVGQVLRHPWDPSKRTEFAGILPQVSFGGERPEMNTTSIVDAWKDVAAGELDYLKTLAEQIKKIAAVQGEPLREVWADMLPDIERVLGQELPDHLKSSIEEVIFNTGGAGGGGTGPTVKGEGFDPYTAMFGLQQLGFLDPLVDEIAVAFEESQKTWKERAGEMFDELAEKASGFFEAASGVGQVVGDLLARFWSLVTSTETFQELLEQVMSALQLIVEEVVLPLYQALKPILDVLMQFLAAFTEVLLPLIDMVGRLFAALAPVLKTVGDVLISLTKVVIQLLAPVFSIVEILVNAIHPILKALVPILDLLGLVVSGLTPVFDMLGFVVKVVATPIATLGAFFQWLGNIMYNFGKFVSNVIDKPLRPWTWGRGMKSTNLGKLVKEAVGQVWNSGNTSDYASSYEGWGDLDLGDYSGSQGSSVYGGSTTVQRVPDIYVHQYFNAPILGDGGMREFGELTVEAITDYVGAGGKVVWAEAN